MDLALERQRLTKRYAEMSDGELEKVGKNPRTLTEWARELLREEMAKRGLEWQETPDISEFEASIEMPTDDNLLVLLRKYETATAAAEDKQALRAAGVKAFFFADDEATAQGAIAWTEKDDVKLLVRAADLAVSLELLDKRHDSPANSASTEKFVLNTEHDVQQDGGKPVVLRSYRDITEAMVDRTMLESAGIKCFLYDDNLIRLDWFVSNAVGGVKLVVPQREAAEALKILDDLAAV